MDRIWKPVEVGRHNTEDSCWMILHGKVYDITSFVPKHPGGRSILLKNAGQDASAAFDSVHPVEILEEYLKPDQFLGEVQSGEMIEIARPRESKPSTQSEPEAPSSSAMPPLESMLSIAEIESYAMQRLSPKAISYYVSATDDMLTKVANGQIYRSILLRPRIFVDCTECSLETSILGNKVGLPIYVSPAAVAKLAHPAGEAGIAEACSKFNALQIISKNASMSPPAIVSAGPRAVFAWQLYVLKDISATERTLAQIRKIPQIKFIVLTLDAPFPGKREADERFKMAEVAGGAPPQVWGTKSALTWRKTLEWLSKHTSLPIVLKGIQTHEDAIDVLVDGGIKRGTDVVKALALGAKGVGIGRAALYGLSVGGEKGVERVLKILADETMTAMRLLGVKNVSELSPQHINTSSLTSRLFDGESGLENIDREFQPKL
ncbi:hypothetical protein AAE478_005307 [Parahypoxylon ruwenzoriense]